MLKNSMRNNLKNFLVIFILFTAYFSPYLIFKDNIHIPVHDNLNQLNMLGIFDGKFQAAVLPGQSDEHFTLPGAENIFHLAHFKLDKLLFLNNYFRGFVINEILIRILGFIGLLLLLRSGLFKINLPDHILILVSFAFVSLPFWSPGNLSLVGIPLVIVALYWLWIPKNLVFSYLIIILYAFYSNFFLTGIYVLITLFVLSILFTLKNKRLNQHLILALLIFFLSSIITHLPVFLNEVIYKIPTNRISQDLPVTDIIGSIKSSATIFFRSTVLSPGYQYYLIIPTTMLAMIIALVRKKGEYFKNILPVLLFLVFTCFIYGFFFFRPFYSFYRNFDLGYNFSRIYVLNTPFWYLLWPLTLTYFYRLLKNRKVAVILISVLVLLQLGINCCSVIIPQLRSKPTFREFVSKKQFDQIKENLREKCERVGCIGFFPSVANYNGFKTVGSFSAYYPLSYKNRFERIIEPEIKKHTDLEDYYRRHGSALFLFDDKIGKYYLDQNYIKINIDAIECELDLLALAELGTTHIFSTAEISNAEQIGLSLILSITEPEFYYRLYVYELIL